MKRIWLVRALAVCFFVWGILYAVNFVWKLLFVNDPSGSFQMVTASGYVINRSMDCMDFIAFAVLMTAWNNLYHFREKGRKYAIFLLVLSVLGNGFWVALSIAGWFYNAPFILSYSGKTIVEMGAPYITIFFTTMFLLSVFFLVFLLQKETRMLFHPPPQTAGIPPASNHQPTAN